MNLDEEFGRAVRASQAGDFRTAEKVCGKILRQSPRHIGALSLLAALDFRGGDLEAGIRHTKAVLKLKPDDVDALFNLGHALTLQHHLAEALDCYDKLLAKRPDHAAALGNRGAIMLLLDRGEEALANFQRAAALQPNWLAAAVNVGLALAQLKRHEEALAAFEQALARDPDNELLLFAKGGVLEELNRTDEAIATYEKILSKNPNSARARFAHCKAQLPVLYRDAGEIAARRVAYARCLDVLAADARLIADPVQDIEIKLPYYLAYQGENDRDLQTTYGRLACKIMATRFPQQIPKGPRPNSGKPLKIGVVSGFFRQHSVWKIPTRGLIGGLDRDRFRVFGYHTGQSVDAQTEIAKTMCEHFVLGLPSIEAWRKAILNDSPDILIYPEIGMDPMAAQLAAQRLAPVQCNYGGHPTTSGLPTLDYFLSSDLMEPKNGQDHYSERLVRLPNLGFAYEPAADAPLSGAAEIGLRPGSCRFWCGQSTFKYLPQYDQVFPRIAKLAGDCQFIFIASQVSPSMTEFFRERVSRTFSDEGLDVGQYCVFLPRLSESEFGGVQAQSDMLLDSIGWSGNNSTLESLAYDIPIVTLPGELMRGRHSMAILKMMGVTSTIANSVDEYVAVAGRLARAPSERAQLAAQIAAGKHKLYCDRSVIAALEEFLEKAVQPG